MKEYYSDSKGIKALSFNAIFNIIVSNRDYGKTWTFKKRAFKRGMKHGKRTIWLRLFKGEAKECINAFYTSKDLQEYCGISVYDKDSNPKGNFKQIGNTFYCRNKPRARWRWFLKVYSLADVGRLRSVDDVDTDTIVFDEFTKPFSKYKHYHGSIVDDFIDIYYSVKREHRVKCILIGNKESINNPFYTYFNIPPLPSSFEGIKRYREGSIIVQQINNPVVENDEYDRKERALFEGTKYGNFIYHSDYKANNGLKPCRTPQDATLYTQLIINGIDIKVLSKEGFFYVSNKIDTTRHIYCDVLPHKYAKERMLVNRYKQYFIGLINALADNRVRYESLALFEAIQPFYDWLNVS